MFKLDPIDKRDTIFSVLAIIAVSLIFILDPRFFINPGLRSDDWNLLIEPTVFGSFDFINFSNRRPFYFSLFAVLSPIFHLRISLYYVVNWLLILFSGLTFYQILRSAFPKYRWLALPGALIFIIYPVNYARTWLITTINTFALMLGLISILLLVLYSKDGKTWHLFLGNLLAMASLGTYEVALGIILLTAAILMLNRETPKKRRYLMLSSILLVILFLSWRLLYQPRFFEVNDFYLESFTVSPTTLLRRFAQGLFIFLFNWVGLLLIPLGDIKYWVFTIAGAILLAFLIILIWRRIKGMGENEKERRTGKMQEAKALLKISGVGFLFWAAGYVPVIALWQPFFYGDESRVNFGAIPGASLVIVALIGASLIILFKERSRVKKWVLISMIPFIVAGMAYQVHAQNIRQGVWQVKQDFWSRMFEVVPGIEPGTKVVIAIPDYENLGPFEMLPFRGDWEAESALRVLYNTEELFAEYYYIDWTGAPDNWQPVGGDLGRFIFVYYDPKLSELRIVQDPYTALDLPYEIENYDPEQRIIPFDQEMGKFRFLVE